MSAFTLNCPPSIYSPYFLSNAMCVPLNESPGTHMYNACHPLPARNLACSDIGNELQTAARSSVRTLRCWWHKNGQLKRKTKIQRADLERNSDEKHAAKVSISPIYGFMEVLSDLWFDCDVTSAPTRCFPEMMTSVLTPLPDNTSESCHALSHEQSES